MMNDEFGMRNWDLKERTKRYSIEVIKLIGTLYKEANELVSIIIASITTARKNKN